MAHGVPSRRLAPVRDLLTRHVGSGFVPGAVAVLARPGPSVGSYGWSGFYGTAWYNDPAEDLTALFLMQRAHAGDQRLPMWRDLWTALYAAIDD